MIKKLMRRVRALPLRVQDGAVALVLMALSIYSLVDHNAGDPKTDVWAYAIAIVGMGALTWRRTNPLGTLIVAAGAAVAMSSLGYGEAGLPFAAMVAFYSVAAHARRRIRLIAFLLLGVAFLILYFTNPTSDFHEADFLANGLAFAVVWIIGEGVRSRRERLANAIERAERLERERVEDARLAVSSERLRIAQELHDVVAHAMSVIAVQSGMGAHVIDTQPDEAKKALQAIETTSRSALDELRRMLGVLREEGDSGGALAPAPWADEVHTLIETVRAAGVPVELHWDGMTADVLPPDSVLLNRYRILQEALTNVLKHAGTASVVVTIVERVGETTVEIVDNGRGLAVSAKAPGSPPGHGLVGMRERVALFGGTLETGPRVGGGFRVRSTALDRHRRSCDSFVGGSPMTINVVVADDQALVRGGFSVLLRSAPDIDVVGEAGDGAEAVEVVLRERPDVVLMDIRMPVIDGIEATRRIIADERTAATRILIVTTFDLDEYVYDGLRAGASGFLLKDTRPDVLLDAVRVVAAGEALLAPQITRRLIEEFTTRPAPSVPATSLDVLTEREREVLVLVARGHSNAEIAERLFMSPATSKTHVSRLLMKLESCDRAQLVMRAYEAGLVTPGVA